MIMLAKYNLGYWVSLGMIVKKHPDRESNPDSRI